MPRHREYLGMSAGEFIASLSPLYSVVAFDLARDVSLHLLQFSGANSDHSAITLAVEGQKINMH